MAPKTKHYLVQTTTDIYLLDPKAGIQDLDTSFNEQNIYEAKTAQEAIALHFKRVLGYTYNADNLKYRPYHTNLVDGAYHEVDKLDPAYDDWINDYISLYTAHTYITVKEGSK